MKNLYYKDLIALNFKRNDYSDPVFKDKHGYDSFDLSLNLARGLELRAHPEKKFKVELIEYKNEKVLAKREVTHEECQELIKIFARKGDLDEYPKFPIVA